MSSVYVNVIVIRLQSEVCLSICSELICEEVAHLGFLFFVAIMSSNKFRLGF